MNEDVIEFLLNFGANLMKEGIKRIANGLPKDNLGVFASLRETQIPVGTVDPVNAASPHR